MAQPPSFSANYLDRQLAAAIHFKSLQQTLTPIAPTHTCVGGVVNRMIECIEFEANESYSAKLKTVNAPLLHVVNMTSSNPGIISEVDQDKCTIHKLGNTTANTYQTGHQHTPPRSKEQYLKHAQKKQNKMLAKNEKYLEKLQVKQQLREQKKAQKPPTEKKPRQPSVRMALKQKVKQLDKQLKKTTDPDEKSTLESHHQLYSAALELETDKFNKKKEDQQIRKAKKKQRATLVDADMVDAVDAVDANDAVNAVDILDNVDGVDAVDAVDAVNANDADDTIDDVHIDQVNSVESTTMDKVNATTQDTQIDQLFEQHNLENNNTTTTIDNVDVYASPIVFTRHIDALSRCDPNDIFVPTLLYGHPIDKNFLEIIHGPPGTGKTYTIIERLKVLLKTTRDKILVTAPSNVGVINLYNRAVDAKLSCTLVSSRSQLPTNTVIRENLTNNRPNNRIYFSTVSMRNNRLLASKKFQTVFLDEAAQCPECWTWGLFRKEVHRFVMTGDPHQLPSTVSMTGQKLNHHVSLMERLMSLGVQATLLDTQRRMHPDIVAFPNTQFYQGQLKTLYTPSRLTDDSAFNIIDVRGTEQQKGTSYYNHDEAVESIAQYKKYSETFDDIVMIVPYRAQQEHLLNLDKTLHIHTVDSFQGQEADVVIISTVRTTTMGFWQDSRRLNVALTRARHVECIIGHLEAWKTNDMLDRLATASM